MLCAVFKISNLLSKIAMATSSTTIRLSASRRFQIFSVRALGFHHKTAGHMGDDINPYNVYAPCIGPGPSSPGYCFTQHALLAGAPASQTFVPCINESLPTLYMNQPSVQTGRALAMWLTESSSFCATGRVGYLLAGSELHCL